MLRGESPPLYIYSFLVYFTKVKYTEISYIYCPPPLTIPLRGFALLSSCQSAANLLQTSCNLPA